MPRGCRLSLGGATGLGGCLQPALKAIGHDFARELGTLFDIFPQLRYAVLQLLEAMFQHRLLGGEMLLDSLAEFFPKESPFVTFGVAKLPDHPAHLSPGALLRALFFGHLLPSPIPPPCAP